MVKVGCSETCGFPEALGKGRQRGPASRTLAPLDASPPRPRPLARTFAPVNPSPPHHLALAPGLSSSRSRSLNPSPPRALAPSPPHLHRSRPVTSSPPRPLVLPPSRPVARLIPQPFIPCPPGTASPPQLLAHSSPRILALAPRRCSARGAWGEGSMDQEWGRGIKSARGGARRGDGESATTSHAAILTQRRYYCASTLSHRYPD